MLFADIFRLKRSSEAVLSIPVRTPYPSVRLLIVVPAVGVLGATVMPHSLFLGSRLATQDRLAKDSETNSGLPKLSETSASRQMTLSQRVLRSIRFAFSWRRLFSMSRSGDTSYPSNVLTHADRENNKLDFVRSHMYHGMADVIASLMGFAVVINSL